MCGTFPAFPLKPRKQKPSPCLWNSRICYVGRKTKTICVSIVSIVILSLKICRWKNPGDSCCSTIYSNGRSNGVVSPIMHCPVTLLNAIILPYVWYCIPCWCQVNKTDLNPIKSLHCPELNALDRKSYYYKMVDKGRACLPYKTVYKMLEKSSEINNIKFVS